MPSPNPGRHLQDLLADPFEGGRRRRARLPTAERPLWMAEFDAFFAEVVTEGRSAEPSVAGRAAELTAAETGCCSFFTLTLTATGGALGLETSVSDRHTKVLDALTARAAEVMGVSGLRS